MARNYTIAIVGGGASGVGLVAKMVESLPVGMSTADLAIVLFDAGGCNGGTAYAADVSSNLMNTNCGAVDRAFGGGYGILEWAEEHPAKWQPYVARSELDAGTYLPRPVVGLYLADLVDHARRKATERGFRLDVVTDEVFDIFPPRVAGDSYALRTRTGTCVNARYVYLALGHLEPVKSESYQEHDRYYHNAYPITRLVEEIPKQASVGVKGTRLSAIDVALGLVAAGHTGKIVCVSRGGRLPAVRADQGGYQFAKLERDDLVKRLTGTRIKLRLADVAEMLGSEIEHAEGRRMELGDVIDDDLAPLAYYEREIGLSKGRARPWQAVLYATNRNIDLLWHFLEEEDKRLLMSEWLNDWLTYRASIPRENAERILNLMKSGQLTVAGGAGTFEFDSAAGAFRITLADDAVIEVDYLVSATGYASRIDLADSALMRNLLRRGLVVPHRYGGLDCIFETGEVIPRAEHATGDTRMFALGPLTSGVYFFTTALEIIERQATQRTRDLAYMLGIEWLERPETDAWVDAQQTGKVAQSDTSTPPGDDGPDLLHRVVLSEQMDLIDFKQLHLLNDQIDGDGV